MNFRQDWSTDNMDNVKQKTFFFFYVGTITYNELKKYLTDAVPENCGIKLS